MNTCITTNIGLVLTVQSKNQERCSVICPPSHVLHCSTRSILPYVEHSDNHLYIP